MLSSVEIFGPVFFKGTVTSDVYFSLLRDGFVPFLQGYGIKINTAKLK
jgi:hypothetical protein